MKKHSMSAWAVVTVIALAQPALAQGPRKPDDVTPLLERTDEPRSKSDAYRIVGKVLEIDREGGSLKLATDEGERVVKPTPQLLAAARVGDTVSVARSDDGPVNASPRTPPRSSPRTR